MAQLCNGCKEPVPLKAPGMQDPPTAGYCSTSCYMHHYNARRKRERWALRPPVVHTCPICSASWSTVPGASPTRIYCSSQCRAEARRRSHRMDKRTLTCPCGVDFTSARTDARFCSIPCNRRAQRNSTKKLCSVEGCERPFRAKGMCNYCYRKDRGEKALWTDARRDAYHRRRALKAETSTGRPVLLADIRERDGNRCHLCSKAVPNKAWPHPLSASLDHVIPLSRGGIHDPDNVKLAHLRCNVEKGAGGGNEQLLLIG